MKRPGITTQLFLAVFAVVAVTVGAMAFAAHQTFQTGFIGYLNEQAVSRMDAVIPRLALAYAERGGWDFLRGHPEIWFDLIGVAPNHAPVEGVSREAERGIIESDLLGAGRRMTLMDAQRQRVIGFPDIQGRSVQREIIVDGRTAGWLAIAPLETATDAASLRFGREQLQASLAMAVLALLAASLLAWWVARTLLAPVREVAHATHRLAGGAYETRVHPQGHDEIAQLAQDFNRLAQALESTEQMRRSYMADVSHELRTPLSVLRGELEAMEDGVRQPTSQALAALKTEVLMLAKLVDDLHELALADVGALSYRKTDLDLVTLVEHELHLARRAGDERGVAVEATLPHAPLLLHADEGRIRQLLHNLIGNALRYTQAPGEVQVRLMADADNAVLDVMDSPPGVSDEVLGRLLDRFFRAEGSRGRAGGGSGLGLAICKSIVQAHGGTIEARHSPLGGVWLHVQLPLQRREVR
jgi:two-component system, OmpR family, sensor histidine kinase BaeS